MEHMQMKNLAASATLHCLTGCAIGEISGLVIGLIFGLPTAITIALSVTLAFAFGYGLSLLPLLGAGLAVKSALPIVLAADTLSITVMEIVDNAVMLLVPGAMSTIVHPLFWVTLAGALAMAYAAAYPVNRYLLSRGKGHALLHSYHGDHAHHHHE